MTFASVWKLGHGLWQLAEGALVAVAAKDAKDDACGCCDVPETSCPPRCVGEVHWKIGRGATPQASLVVRNVGKVARTFVFSATPLSGVDAGAAALDVQPASALLQPGQSVPVRATLQNSLSLTPCQDYRAEILIRGSWEQCVAVRCHVEADAFASAQVAQANSLTDKALHTRTLKDAIDWKIERGVIPEAAITLHNTGSSAQSFSLQATPLVGPNAAAATLALGPDALQLARGATGVVRVKLQNSAVLSPGHAYLAEIVVQGAYEQRLPVCCFIEPDASGHCEVAQGEAPTHIRAHHWYDHFQCTHSCLPG